jgi:hypothetical protein
MKIARKVIIFSTLLGLCASQVQAVTKHDVDLVKAVKKAKCGSVVYYLHQGADVNVQIGQLKETPLMLAIKEAAAEAEHSVSVGKEMNSIVSGFLLTALSLGSLVGISPALLDEDLRKDARDILQGNENSAQSKGRRLLRRGVNYVNNVANNLVGGDANEDSVHIRLISYDDATQWVPDTKLRVFGLGLLAVALSAGTIYGLGSFVKGMNATCIQSIRDLFTHYSRIAVIKTLLATPSINVAATNANGQTALDMVRSSMVNTKNEKVSSVMKSIEAMLLEKP